MNTVVLYTDGGPMDWANTIAGFGAVLIVVVLVFGAAAAFDRITGDDWHEPVIVGALVCCAWTVGLWAIVGLACALGVGPA